MSKRAIINVANGHAYPIGQDRLLDSLHKVGYLPSGKTFTWRNKLPRGSPPHTEQPYSFKLHAMQAAAEEGYTSLLWLDAATWAVKDLGPFFDRIEREGHYFFHGGATLGQCCSDEALRIMEFEREEAFKIQLIGGTVYGLDLANPRTWSFWEGWWNYYRLGAFKGFAINKIAEARMSGLAGRPVGFVSHDDRVNGHNHDESVATVLAHRHGMASVGIMDGFAPYSPQNAADPKVYIVSQGL